MGSLGQQLTAGLSKARVDSPVPRPLSNSNSPSSSLSLLLLFVHRSDSNIHLSAPLALQDAGCADSRQLHIEWSEEKNDCSKRVYLEGPKRLRTEIVNSRAVIRTFRRRESIAECFSGRHRGGGGCSFTSLLQFSRPFFHAAE